MRVRRGEMDSLEQSRDVLWQGVQGMQGAKPHSNCFSNRAWEPRARERGEKWIRAVGDEIRGIGSSSKFMQLLLPNCRVVGSRTRSHYVGGRGDG